MDTKEIAIFFLKLIIVEGQIVVGGITGEGEAKPRHEVELSETPGERS